MRYQGHNILAIIVAAFAMYGMGALIYGLLFAQMWRDAVGYDPADYVGLEWRMAVAAIPPLLLAVGVSVAHKWRNKSGMMAGAMTGLLVAFFFLFAARLYQFAYTAESEIVLGLDALHFFLISLVGGAIIGAWK